MKATFSQITNDGLYTIRQSLGGAAYTAWSGIPYMIDEFNATVTFEGDNTVLLQLAAKGILSDFRAEFNSAGFTSVLKLLQTQPKAENSW